MNTIIGKRKENVQVSIKEIIYAANAFNIQNWTGDYKMNFDNLPKSVDEFLKLLSRNEIEIVIVGGIALLSYMQDRNTQDLDLIISPADFRKISASLKVIEADDDFANCETFDGLKVDFLFTDNAIFNYVKKAFCQKRIYREGSFYVATVEGLVLMKLYAWADLYLNGNVFNDKYLLTKSLRYKNDIEILLLNYEIDLIPLKKILKKNLKASKFGLVENLIKQLQAS